MVTLVHQKHNSPLKLDRRLVAPNPIDSFPIQQFIIEYGDHGGSGGRMQMPGKECILKLKKVTSIFSL